MKRLLLIALALLALGASPVSAQAPRKFYIDYANGSNSNPGTTAAPWKTHPYMHHGGSCDSGAPSYTHVAGDNFIFRGGVTWPAACFTMLIPAGGNSSAQDYYGVDQTWFSGASWTRPLWDMNYTNTFGDFIVQAQSSDTGYHTFDNIEVAHQLVTLYNNMFEDFEAFQFQYGASGSILENMYIHDWATNANVSPSLCPQGCAWYDVGGVNGSAGLVDPTSPSSAVRLLNSTISDQNGYYFVGGVKHTGGFGGALRGGYEASGDTFSYTSASCFDTYLCHDSQFLDPDGSEAVFDTVHTQVIEDDGGGNSVNYNDYIFDATTAVTTLLCPGSPFFNSVATGSTNQAAIRIDSGFCFNQTPSSATENIYNNTIDGTVTGSALTICARMTNGSCGDGGVIGTVNTKNNVFIGVSGSGISTVGTVTNNNATNNRPMNSTEANMYGFVIANKYKPSSADPNTVGQGVNLSSLCVGILTPLCSDTSGAPWFGSSYVTRPTTPDLGAFQGTGGAVNPPAVSISISPSTQPVSGSIFATSTCTPQSPATIASQSFTIDGFPFGSTGTVSPYSVIFNTTTSANGQHVIKSTCTDSNSLQTSASIKVTVSNSMPGCFVSGPLTAVSSQSFNAQTGTFNFTIGPITPWTNDQDTVIAFSVSPMTAYGQGAVLFRFNSSGNIDAWSNAFGNYTAVNPAPYSASGNYSFSGTINIPAGTYSLSETSPSSIVIATNYQFRSTATPSPLGFINGISDNSTPDTAKVCNLSIGGTAGALAIAPASLNFGNVPLTSSPTKTVVGTVTGNPVTISSTPISGTNAADFALGTSTCTGTVGASCSIPIIFTPSLVGAESATLTVNSNASNTPQTVALSGSGIAQASASCTSFSFGTVKTSQSVTLSCALTNNGAGTLTSIVESYSGNSQFAIASATSPDCQSTSSLAFGASCNFALTFTPTAATSYTGTLSLASSMTGSPITIAATGTGQATLSLSLSPTSLAFGSLPVSSPVLLIVTGTTSGGSITFSSVTVTGTNAADFVIGTNTCTGTVVSTCSIPITFTPSLVGSESATLNVTSNATGSPQTVALSGTGTAQGAVNPTSLAFGNVFTGNSSILQATFTNSGGASLTSVAVTPSGTGFSLVAPTGTDCRASSLLPAGVSCNIGVQFAPGSATTFSGSVSVSSSMIGSPLSISLSGTGVAPPTPVLTFNLSEIDFGSFALTGTSLPIGLIGTPSGGSVTFTGNPVLGGTNAADFALPTNSCLATISAPCTTTVQFTPSIVGPESATLTYANNATGNPQVIVLTGAGLPQAAVSPGALGFGNVRIGSISQMAVTLKNNGGLPLGSIVVSYSGASQFTLSAPSGADCRSIASLPAGSSCTIAMQFLPTTNSTFTGTLSIASSMLGSPLQVAVSGTGKKGGRPSGGKNFVGLVWRTFEGKGE